MQNNNNLVDCCDNDKLANCSTTPNLEQIENLADFFKIFGDKTRIRILYILKESDEDELCVSCIAKHLNMSNPAVSQQLKILKTNRLIKSRKDGKEVYYSLNDYHIHHILDDGIVHINEIFPQK